MRQKTKVDTGAVDTQSHAPAPRLLNLKEAARYLGLSYWTVREAVVAGQVPRVDLPSLTRPGETLRRVLVDRQDLDKWIERWKTRVA